MLIIASVGRINPSSTNHPALLDHRWSQLWQQKIDLQQKKGQNDQKRKSGLILYKIKNTCGFEARCLAAQSPAAPAPTTATAKGEELMILSFVKSAMFAKFIACPSANISDHEFSNRISRTSLFCNTLCYKTIIKLQDEMLSEKLLNKK